MTLTDLYLFMVILPNLHEFATSPVILLPVMLLIGGILALVGGHAEDAPVVSQMGAKAIRWAASLLALLCLVYVLTPSHTQMYGIAGGYVTTNTKEVEKLPENLIGAANAWLKKAAELAETAEPKPKKKQ